MTHEVSMQEGFFSTKDRPNLTTEQNSPIKQNSSSASTQISNLEHILSRCDTSSQSGIFKKRDLLGVLLLRIRGDLKYLRETIERGKHQTHAAKKTQSDVEGVAAKPHGVGIANR